MYLLVIISKIQIIFHCYVSFRGCRYTLFSNKKALQSLPITQVPVGKADSCVAEACERLWCQSSFIANSSITYISMHHGPSIFGGSVGMPWNGWLTAIRMAPVTNSCEKKVRERTFTSRESWNNIFHIICIYVFFLWRLTFKASHFKPVDPHKSPESSSTLVLWGLWVKLQLKEVQRDKKLHATCCCCQGPCFCCVKLLWGKDMNLGCKSPEIRSKLSVEVRKQQQHLALKVKLHWLYLVLSVLSPCPALPALCVQCLWSSTEPAASSFLQAHHVVRHSRVLVQSQDSQVLPAPLLSLLDPGAQLPLALPLDCWPLWPPPDQPWQQTWRTARPCSRAIAPPAMLVATTASWPRRSWRRMPWWLTASTMWVLSLLKSPTATAPCPPSATSWAQMTSRTKPVEVSVLSSSR